MWCTGTLVGYWLAIRPVPTSWLSAGTTGTTSAPPSAPSSTRCSATPMALSPSSRRGANGVPGVEIGDHHGDQAHSGDQCRIGGHSRPCGLSALLPALVSHLGRPRQRGRG